MNDADSLLDCLIIGGGPAGLTAALYLRRFHRSIAVVDAAQSRALHIHRSWNLPGFPDGISGEALLARMRQQVSNVAAEVVEDRIESLERDAQGRFTARSATRSWASRTVVIATGSRDREADLPGLQELKEAGLLRECPICDGHEHSGHRIGVIGSSTHGAREALFLRHYSDKVHLMAPHPCDEVEDDWLDRLGRCEVSWHGAGIRQLDRHCEKELAVTLEDGHRATFDILYSALGCQPASALARGLGAQCDEAGNLLVDAHGCTTVGGLYAAGDVTAGLDQIVVALAQGATAATAIHNELCAADEVRR